MFTRPSISEAQETRKKALPERKRAAVGIDLSLSAYESIYLERPGGTSNPQKRIPLFIGLRNSHEMPQGFFIARENPNDEERKA